MAHQFIFVFCLFFCFCSVVFYRGYSYPFLSCYKNGFSCANLAQDCVKILNNNYSRQKDIVRTSFEQR